MDLLFDAVVERRDGDALGTLRRLVCDSDTLEVRDLVVRGSHWDDDEVLIPMGAVEAADGDAITVALSQEQFDGLNYFSTSRNIAPPPSMDNATDVDEGAVDVPEEPPVGAATGVESIAYTPIIEDVPNLDVTEDVIDSATTVYATDGEMGKVTGVHVDDETHRLTGIMTERGFVFKHSHDISGNWIENLSPETITLRISHRELDAMPPEE